MGKYPMKCFSLILPGIFISLLLAAQQEPERHVLHAQKINCHEVVLDRDRKIISWIVPQSKAYDTFLHQRWSFIRNHVPDYPGTGYPQYYFSCGYSNQNYGLASGWMNDIGEKIPNWFESARLYYAYTGDMSVMEIVKGLVDYAMEHGTSPADFAWPDFPYTTTNAGDRDFRGFTTRLALHEVQVDHAADMGLTYYRMYQFFGDEKYEEAALHVADVLAENARTGSAEKSVWPYRVNMETGEITARYGANWMGAYSLLNSLAGDGVGNVALYRQAAEKAREFILNYPVKTGYWTDGHTDTDINSTTYRSNMRCSNAKLYLLDHPEFDPRWKTDIPEMIAWTEKYFVERCNRGEPSTQWGANLVGEQDDFLPKMDYQTARYSAACARWYAVSGDESYKEKAYRSLNWVTYCNDSAGMAYESPVSVDVESWWSDCYGECPRMFYHVFAAVPEWAPPGENHILYSESVLKDVRYARDRVRYTAGNSSGKEYLRIAFKPVRVVLNGQLLKPVQSEDQPGYILKDLGNQDYSVIVNRNGPGVVIVDGQPGEHAEVDIDGSVKFQVLDGFGVNINTAWWYDGRYRETGILEPAIDLLVDSLGASVFRAVIEEIDWEAVNDNGDPDTFNWDCYNQVFSGTRFQGVWNTLRYLNRKGITDGLIISFMGAPPAAAPPDVPEKKASWMGGTDYSIDSSMEDELVESIAALLYYARNTAGIRFSLVSPMNETDIISLTGSAEHPDGIVEGPNIPDAVQYARIVKKLGKKLDDIDMGDIHFVMPDAGGAGLFDACMEEMAKDPYTMSKLAHWGVHDYGGSAANYRETVQNSANSNKSFWVTEMAGIDNLFGQLGGGAGSYIYWDGFDCVYQHARRNGYGDTPPNDWVFWFGEGEGKPLIEYVPSAENWMPRKQFYEFAQVFRFVKPGATRIGAFSDNDSLVVRSFLNPGGQLVIAGRNMAGQPVSMTGTFGDLPSLRGFRMVCTTADENFQRTGDILPGRDAIQMEVPANSVFTLISFPDHNQADTSSSRPEPPDWYAGDMHVHRNCGEVTGIVPDRAIVRMMEQNDLAVVTMLADMGNAEVKPSETDLPKVNGSDASESIPGRILHWDAEWHFDPAGVTFDNQAIGGHLVLLGLKEAHQIWEESPYKILDWAKEQGAVTGFCHMEYLNGQFPDELNCCAPLDFPVEAALGTIDFLAEDVWVNDAAVEAYYKLLNCGFRLGWAAGTDFPCNNSEPVGSLLTYVQVEGSPLTYEKWIDGIKNGRTVVSLNGHDEFLDLKVNDHSGPGDEIDLNDGGRVPVSVTWTAAKELTGTIELVCNGKVVATREGTAFPGRPVLLETALEINESSWICARRMNGNGHRSHTAPVYVSVNNQPVRASAEDAAYFVDWIDNLIRKTSPGQDWNQYFTGDLDRVQDRYRQARAVFEKIKSEAEEARTTVSTPVLILATNAEYGTYTAEILKAEGFNAFHMDSLTGPDVSPDYLRDFNLVLLAGTGLTKPQREMFAGFVRSGGNLIAFMPDKSLDRLFGIKNTGQIFREGYIRTDPDSKESTGITPQRMQFHGIAGKYELNGAKLIASLLDPEGGSESLPGVVSSQYGKGHAVAFLYNLPQSIVYTRQGNPLFAGLEKDGIPGLRGMDLFTDGWVDTTMNTLNQADQQMALLTNCIRSLNEYTCPLPRMWYFPDSLKCLVVLDNDGEDNNESDFEPQFRDVDSMGAKMTLYIKDADKVSKEWVDRWTAKGFEIAGHPDDTRNADNPSWNSMDSALAIRTGQMNGLFGLDVRTNVNHWFVWCGKDESGTQDFGAQAKLEEKHGMEMDANYAFYDMNSNQPEHYLGSHGTNQGNYTGSGLVMKYADVHGRTVNVYQRYNAIYDQQYNESHDPEGFFNAFRGLMDRSLNDDIYSVVSIKSHNNEYYFSKEPLMDMLGYADSKGIPVWTALNLLDFLKMKDEASFTDFRWSGYSLSFRLNSTLKHGNGLTFMIPAMYMDKKIAGITKDGRKACFSIRQVKGIDYAFVTVRGGSDYEFEIRYHNN